MSVTRATKPWTFSKECGLTMKSGLQRERDIESWLRKEIEKLGGEFWKFTSPGRDGVPDRIALLPYGRIVFVELKTTGGSLSPIQCYQINRILELGQDVCVIHGRSGAEDFIYDLESENTLAREYGRR